MPGHLQHALPQGHDLRLGLVGIALVIDPQPFVAGENLLLLGVVTAVAAAFINVLSIFMRKRTAGGNDILGKLLGFKNFIEVAEKPRLEKLVEENPSYYYDVIPYAYVLGVSDKWAKKFEHIFMTPPSWVDGYPANKSFNALVFVNSMNSFGNSVVSHSTYSSGGGGGGSSGGGSGGGGGGSW